MPDKFSRNVATMFSMLNEPPYLSDKDAFLRNTRQNFAFKMFIPRF